MKKYLLLIVTLVLSLSPIYAQKKHDDKKSREEMHKELREFKMKYLAQEIDLQEKQQKQFFEIYDEYASELHGLMHSRRKMEKKIHDEKNCSEEDYKAVCKAITDSKEKEAALEKKYDAQFAKVLSAKQIVKLKEAEAKFRERMREMRGRRKGKSR